MKTPCLTRLACPALIAALTLAAWADQGAIAPLRRDALAAQARLDPPTALDLLLRAHAAEPNDAAVLQEISRQYSDLSIDARDPAEKKHLCALALDFARRAVALEPGQAENLLSLAISYGKLGLLVDTRTRIEYSRLVKQYADEALALDPNNAYAHHVLGRWNYEVAALGPARRLLVNVIYGGLPRASTGDAVRHLQRAVELAPASPAHHAELGFALLADGQQDAARQEFLRALTLPIKEAYDREELARARAALTQ